MVLLEPIDRIFMYIMLQNSLWNIEMVGIQYKELYFYPQDSNFVVKIWRKLRVSQRFCFFASLFPKVYLFHSTKLTCYSNAQTITWGEFRCLYN